MAAALLSLVGKGAAPPAFLTARARYQTPGAKFFCCGNNPILHTDGAVRNQCRLPSGARRGLCELAGLCGGRVAWAAAAATADETKISLGRAGSECTSKRVAARCVWGPLRRLRPLLPPWPLGSELMATRSGALALTLQKRSRRGAGAFIYINVTRELFFLAAPGPLA